jgi:hypothetical protein
MNHNIDRNKQLFIMYFDCSIRFNISKISQLALLTITKYTIVQLNKSMYEISLTKHPKSTCRHKFKVQSGKTENLSFDII